MAVTVDRYAVIGNPIAHSKSPAIHAAFARETGERLIYERILAPVDRFEATVEAFAASGGRGMNVTLPFKERAFSLAQETTARARAACACNTLAWQGSYWLGENTDGVGLLRDLTENLQVVLSGRRILLLGAGGAAAGIVGPLLATAPATLTIVNRTRAKAQALADRFFKHAPSAVASANTPTSAAPLTLVAAEALTNAAFDIVINATSTSVGDEVALPWPTTIFAPGALAYDLMYADTPTAFLLWARAHGAAMTRDGLGMLIEQAAESFFLWRGVRPATAPVFALLRSPAA